MMIEKQNNMKLINILKQLILEKKQDSYKYGYVMLDFNFPHMNKIQDAIDPSNLYEEEGDRTYGLEDEPHITLLFGLHNGVSAKDIKQTLDKFTFNTCQISNASLFKNEKYEVLKFDVKGDNIHKCNDALKQFPYTSNFPDYHPHMTIAYLKPGTGDKYVKMFKDMEYEMTPRKAVYSTTNEKINIPIKN